MGVGVGWVCVCVCVWGWGGGGGQKGLHPLQPTTVNKINGPLFKMKNVEICIETINKGMSHAYH